MGSIEETVDEIFAKSDREVARILGGVVAQIRVNHGVGTPEDQRTADAVEAMINARLHNGQAAGGLALGPEVAAPFVDQSQAPIIGPNAGQQQ